MYHKANASSPPRFPLFLPSSLHPNTYHTTKMPTLASTALATLLATSSYLFCLCNTNPNPPPAATNRPKSDRINWMTGASFVTINRRISLTAGFYHALLALYYPDLSTAENPLLCPRPSNLSPSLFTWSPLTTTCLASLFLGAALRLSAFGALGRSFTFQLSTPDELVTHGIYRFIQHPSYIGQALVLAPALGMTYSWYAGVGCFVDRSVLEVFYGWGGIVGPVTLLGGMVTALLRVRDEERMLRERFGEKWVEWNRTTGRFIPGVV